MKMEELRRLWKEQRGHILADCAVPAILVAVTGIGYHARLLSLWTALAAAGGVLYVQATTAVLHGGSGRGGNETRPEQTSR